jgi:hypothetical protein
MNVLAQDYSAGEIAAALDAEGFVCLENALDPAWVDRASAYVHLLVEKNGNRYFGLNWATEIEGTPPFELAHDPRYDRIMDELVTLGCPKAVSEDRIYSVLRVVTGDRSGDSKSLIYHYDNTVITCLAPILIPSGEPRRAGELLAYPNDRGYRPSALLNVAEKAVKQSSWYRRRVTDRLPAGEIPEVRHIKPGNLYFFWGYRTYHGNFPVGSDMVRATLAMHRGSPHPDSLLLKFLKKRNLARERRNLQAGAAS